MHRIILVSVFFVPLLFYSQEIVKEHFLVQIFDSIQKQHTIQFNYAENLIENIKLKPPNKNLTLKEKLNFLENNTILNFTILDKTFVLVTSKQGFVFCGYVKSLEDLEPLAGATLKIGNQTVISDINGYFKLNTISEKEEIDLYYLGYKTIQKNIKKTTLKHCKTIYMETIINKLPEVIISNYLTKGIQKVTNGSFKIDFKKFKILPGQIDNDVLQSVQAFPGIQSINETVSNINIRGGTHDQNLILWDNIKMYQSGHFFGLISMFNPEITQKVYLYKNGTNVAMTDGVSGTIAMQTDNKINNDLKINIGLNLTDFNAFADIPLGKKSSIQLAGRKSISNFLKTPLYNEFFDRISQDTEIENNDSSIINSDKKFDFYDTSLRWNYNINQKSKLKVSFINVANELLFNENTQLNETTISRESKIIQNSIAGSISYTQNWNDKVNTTFEIYETDYTLKAINANILESQRFLQENTISETSVKLNLDYKLTNTFSFLNGYHFTETKVTNLDDIDVPVFRSLIAEVVRSHDVFSELKYNSTKTNFNLGLRYNFIEKFNKIIWEPRLSFNQQLFKNITFQVLGEYKHQNTSQIINFQNDFLGIEKRRWQLANNADIPVIRSKQISVGLDYNKKDWLLSVEYYIKNIDGITSQSQSFQNQYEFVKTSGSYQVNGFDVLIRKKTNHINTWLSYSFMQNEYTFKELETNDFPSNYNIKHTFTLGATYAIKKFNFAAGLNWHSGKLTTQPLPENPIVENQINYDATNKKALKDFMRADISVIYNFKFIKNKKVKLGFSIWNILNTKNEINNFYRIKNDAVVETLQESLGITPNILFKVNF